MKQETKAWGEIVDVLPGLTFRVRMADGSELLCYVAGKVRMHKIRFVRGDRVEVVVAGALYGPLPGLAACTLGSSLGALAAFLFSRRFLRTWVQTHFKKTLAATEAGLKKDGDAWLLSARLIPMVSFAGVNLAMGLSSMKPGRFLLISTLGLLPCNAAYVWAGMHLARIPIHNPADLLSPQLWALLCGVGLLPLLATLVRRLHRSLKEPG